MRDWGKAFRPASFRGVSFFVDVEGASGGRRIASSPVAYSDRHVVEDMGGRERAFQITAYVAGDAADGQARGFQRALQAKGPGTLVLPMGGPVLVVVPSWSQSRAKDRAGYVAFDIEFLSAGLAAPLFAPVPAGLQIAGLMAQAAALFSTAAGLLMRDAGPVQDAQVSISARTVAGSLQGLAAATRLSNEHGPLVDAAARQITLIADKPAGLSPSICGLIASAATHIVERGQPDADAYAGLTATDDDVAGLTAAGVFAAGFCHAVCSVEHLSRQDARAARTRIAPVTDMVSLRLGTAGFSDAAAWLDGIAAIAADYLSVTAANRAPLIRVETGISLPATALAYALYGQADRAGELVSRNRVATPAAMPVTFEALAT